jgi:hypothetical protein
VFRKMATVIFGQNWQFFPQRMGSQRMMLHIFTCILGLPKKTIKTFAPITATAVFVH